MTRLTRITERSLVHPAASASANRDRHSTRSLERGRRDGENGGPRHRLKHWGALEPIARKKDP